MPGPMAALSEQRPTSMPLSQQSPLLPARPVQREGVGSLAYRACEGVISVPGLSGSIPLGH